MKKYKFKNIESFNDWLSLEYNKKYNVFGGIASPSVVMMLGNITKHGAYFVNVLDGICFSENEDNHPIFSTEEIDYYLEDVSDPSEEIILSDKKVTNEEIMVELQQIKYMLAQIVNVNK